MRTTRRTAVLISTLAIGLISASASAQTKTAQSIMIDTSGVPTTLAIVNTQVFKLNITSAATYFTNTWDGNAPTVACTGNQTACGNPAPAAPAAPAPDASVVIGNGPGNIGNDGIVGANRCVFLDGGSLSGSSYTQIVDVEVGAGSSKRKYRYTYQYNVTPTVDPVAAFTAWDLFESSGDGTAHVDVTALIAGESVSVSKNLGTKYSFSLLQNDGLTVRVSNVGVSVDGGVVDYSGTTTYADRNPAGATPNLDYLYAANALLANGSATASLVNNQTALNILNGVASVDVFPGNNNGGANGQALAAVLLSGIAVDLAPGLHTISISATVKDNAGVLVGNVSVNATVNIVTPGCGS
jgi:hypothetical protein